MKESFGHLHFIHMCLASGKNFTNISNYNKKEKPLKINVPLHIQDNFFRKKGRKFLIFFLLALSKPSMPVVHTEESCLLQVRFTSQKRRIGRKRKGGGAKRSPFCIWKATFFSEHLFTLWTFSRSERENAPLLSTWHPSTRISPLFRLFLFGRSRKCDGERERGEKEEEEEENDDDGFQSSKNVTTAEATIQFHPHEKKKRSRPRFFTLLHYSRHFYSFQLFF